MSNALAVPTKLLCAWDFPGKNPEVGCHFLPKGIFPTQGSNPCLFDFCFCAWMLSGVQLFVALWAVVCQAPLPRGFSRWSSQSRDLTHISFVSYLVKWILYHWATRDTPIKNSINTKKNERKWALPSKFHSFQLISSLFLPGQYIDSENLFYWKWPLLLLSRFSRVWLCATP